MQPLGVVTAQRLSPQIQASQQHLATRVAGVDRTHQPPHAFLDVLRRAPSTQIQAGRHYLRFRIPGLRTLQIPCKGGGLVLLYAFAVQVHPAESVPTSDCAAFGSFPVHLRGTFAIGFAVHIA